MKLIDGVEVVSTGEKWVELKNGTFKINGKLYNAGYSAIKVVVESFDDVKTYGEYSKITHYEDSNGASLTVGEYNTQYNTLYSTEDNGDNYEDVYNFQVFLNTWKSIREDYTKTENVNVQIKKLHLDTGNVFISPEFCYGNDNIDLYRYERKQALIQIVKDVMNSFDMVYQNNVSYGGTNNKRLYSGIDENRRGIRYVVAFGTYVFNDSWDVGNYVRTTLEKCKERYESDVKRITDMITIKHNKHFGIENELDTAKLLSLVSEVKNIISQIDSKKKTEQQYYNALTKAKQLYELVNGVYK